MIADYSRRVRRYHPYAGPLLATLLLTIITGCSDNAVNTTNSQPDHPPSPVLNFTAIPDQNSTELAEKFAPLAAHLSNELDITVNYIPARDYQASVEMFRNGDVCQGPEIVF